jgi:hypothetical protein
LYSHAKEKGQPMQVDQEAEPVTGNIITFDDYFNAYYSD